MSELKFWQVSEPHEGAKQFRAPSTNGTVTARAGGIRIEGNVTNLSGDEYDEFPEVLRVAVAHRDEKKAEREARRAVAEPASAPVATPVSGSGSRRTAAGETAGSQGN